jgi:hypothetical protein
VTDAQFLYEASVAPSAATMFARNKVVAIVPREGKQPAVGIVAPATKNSNPL